MSNEELERRREDNRLWQEVDRLRDRVHTLESKIYGTDLIVRENAKSLKEAKTLLREVEQQMQEVVTADKIADGVADKLAEKADTGIKKWGVRAAIVSAIAAGVGTIIDLILRFFH